MTKLERKYRKAILNILGVLGPKPCKLLKCLGCEAEIAEALKIGRAALQLNTRKRVS